VIFRRAKRTWCVQCASTQDVLNIKNEVVTLVCGHSRARMANEGKNGQDKSTANVSAERSHVR
jgi:hypothetical protein